MSTCSNLSFKCIDLEYMNVEHSKKDITRANDLINLINNEIDYARNSDISFCEFQSYSEGLDKEVLNHVRMLFRGANYNLDYSIDGVYIDWIVSW